jgi:hypothetical protein
LAHQSCALPEDVPGAVAVEVADAGDLKVARIRAEIDGAGRLAVVDQPPVGVAG